MLVPITVKRNKKICRGKDFQNRAVGSGIQTHGKELIDEAKNNRTTPKEKIVTEINKRSKRKVSENSDNFDISKCKCIKQDDEEDNYSSSEESGTDEDSQDSEYQVEDDKKVALQDIVQPIDKSEAEQNSKENRYSDNKHHIISLIPPTAKKK